MTTGKCLFVTGVHKACGVYQYGRRLFDILQRENETTARFRVVCVEVAGLAEYRSALTTHSPDVVVYNYHKVVMPWLTRETIQRRVRNVVIDHDMDNCVGFDVMLLQDPTMADCPESRIFSIPRPIFEQRPSAGHQRHHSVPVIGSFGFGYKGKGVHNVIRQVNAEFDQAHIRLHLPPAHHVSVLFDPCVRDILREPRKPGVTLAMTHHFMTDQDVLQFLSDNSINVFMYDPHPADRPGRVASVIDYALSVDRPFAVSDGQMFKHVLSPLTCVATSSLRRILDGGTAHLQGFRTRWSNQNLRDKFYQVVCCS